MNAQTFHKIINNPSLLNKDSLVEFEKLVSDYPHIENIRILYALNLLILNDYRYKQQLTKAAFFASDRKRLKELIDTISIDLAEKAPSPTLLEKTEVLETTIDTTLEKPGINEIKTRSNISDQEQNKTHHQYENLTEDDAQIISQEKALIKERKTKNELLKLVKKRLLEIENTKNISSEQDAKDKTISNDDLISKFIEQQPSISRADKNDFFSPDNEAIESTIDEDDFFITETLARIHSDQGNNKKAIEIYKKLILKIPEKSIYFAARIEDLNNNKKE